MIEIQSWIILEAINLNQTVTLFELFLLHCAITFIYLYKAVLNGLGRIIVVL
jgi:hypothetical protein